MTFDPHLLTFALVVLMATMAGAIYARQRMNVLHEAVKQQLQRERAAARAAHEDLEKLVSGLRTTADTELLALKGNLSTLQQKQHDHATALTSRVEQLATQTHNADQQVNDIGRRLEALADTVAGIRKDMELQLSADRVGDVEQLAITAALMAGDALALQNQSAPRSVARVLHGHALLLYQMLLDASNGQLAKPRGGYHLIEIGTTREKWWNQMSTSRLAAVCRALGYKMLTVDVDELSSAAGHEASRFYGDVITAHTEAGEEFLAGWKGELPQYIYIDAYDFDHGKHSTERQARYLTLQGAEINDPDCWQMHLKCAEAIAEKGAEGSIVVFDDVQLVDGEWAGKGKLAMPHLLQSGLENTERTTHTAVLRRTSVIHPETPE